MISIHALRGEGDYQGAGTGTGTGISIHALRGEGDVNAAFVGYLNGLFQSTPSVGRATLECRV